jgi:hypothetical protein
MSLSIETFRRFGVGVETFGRLAFNDPVECLVKLTRRGGKLVCVVYGVVCISPNHTLCAAELLSKATTWYDSSRSESGHTFACQIHRCQPCAIWTGAFTFKLEFSFNSAE